MFLSNDNFLGNNKVSGNYEKKKAAALEEGNLFLARSDGEEEGWRTVRDDIEAFLTEDQYNLSTDLFFKHVMLRAFPDDKKVYWDIYEG